MIRALQHAILIVYFVMTGFLYTRLPARFPIHFNLQGAPDRWVEKSVIAWFLLPLIAVGMCFFFDALGSLAASQPNLWNIPRKKEFLALNPAQRAPIVQMMRDFMTGTSIALLILFMTVQLTMYQVAIGDKNKLPSSVIVGLIVATLGIIFASLLYSRAVGRAIEKASTVTGTVT